MAKFILDKGRLAAPGRSHTHEYVNHPDPEWPNHYACRICGFAVVKTAINNNTYRHLIVRG